MLLFAAFARCWWGHTHGIIAQSAQKFLTSKQIARYKKLISHGFNSTDLVTVSTWPDDLNAFRMPAMAEWHYSDVPFIPFDNYSYPYPKPTYNVTSYITDAWATLNNETTTDIWAWTFHVRNLIHFVGDIHTPHHNVGRFTNELPDGDMGGNLYPIVCEWGDACKNIHFFWDSSIMSFPIYYFMYPVYRNDLIKNASLIEEEYPKSMFDDLTSVDVDLWSGESYKVAVELGYSTPANQKPSQEYMEKARKAAHRRIAMAGYRLGHMLKELIESGKMPEFPEESISFREIFLWTINGCCFIAIIVLIILIIRHKSRPDTVSLISHGL